MTQEEIIKRVGEIDIHMYNGTMTDELWKEREKLVMQFFNNLAIKRKDIE